MVSRGGARVSDSMEGRELATWTLGVCGPPAEPTAVFPTRARPWSLIGKGSHVALVLQGDGVRDHGLGT